jgi:hypothetical protein
LFSLGKSLFVNNSTIIIVLKFLEHILKFDSTLSYLYIESKFQIIMVHYCEYSGCNTRPCFNNVGETKGRFCNKHKNDFMVCITSKTCDDPNCFIRPNFNYINETKGRFCNTHKLTNMINVIQKRCVYKGCDVQLPCFNYENEPKGLYCNSHKLNDMVNVRDKKCPFTGCNKKCHFNHSEEPAGKYCEIHKLLQYIVCTI